MDELPDAARVFEVIVKADYPQITHTFLIVDGPFKIISNLNLAVLCDVKIN